VCGWDERSERSHESPWVRGGQGADMYVGNASPPSWTQAHFDMSTCFQLLMYLPSTQRRWAQERREEQGRTMRAGVLRQPPRSRLAAHTASPPTRASRALERRAAALAGSERAARKESRRSRRSRLSRSRRLRWESPCQTSSPSHRQRPCHHLHLSRTPSLSAPTAIQHRWT
jgi:hypothetical protein